MEEHLNVMKNNEWHPNENSQNEFNDFMAINMNAEKKKKPQQQQQQQQHYALRWELYIIYKFKICNYCISWCMRCSFFLQN
jgi:hypothetical protein